MTDQSKPEIVITGAGLITPLGLGVRKNLESVKNLKHGIGFYPKPGTPQRLCYQGRSPDVNFPEWLDGSWRSQFKFLNRCGKMGLIAAGEAVESSGLELSAILPERKGLFIATGDMELAGSGFFMPAIMKARKESEDQGRDFFQSLNTASLIEPPPFYLLESMHNNPFSFISAVFDLRGDNTVLASHSPWGMGALGMAAESLRENRSDMALVVACGSWVSEIATYEMEKLGLLSQCENGGDSYKPFDQNRDGLICGEGAAALVLENSEIAMKRQKKNLAKICGRGCAQIFQGLEKPGSILKSMQKAACQTEYEDFFPHGMILTGYANLESDRREMEAAASFLKDRVNRTPLCSLRSYTGQMGAASDLADIIITALSIKDGFFPATINHEKPEKDFDFLQISGLHRQITGHPQFLLATSLGISDHVGSVLISI